MLDFIKKMLSSREQDFTVLLLEDDNPEITETYRIKPKHLLYIFYSVLGSTVVLLLALFIFTPVGSFLAKPGDEQLQNSVRQIQQKMVALQDSLQNRDQQLAMIQEVLQEGKDTAFSINYQEQIQKYQQEMNNSEGIKSSKEVNAYETVAQEDIIFSEFLNKAPEFPAPFPLDGTLTRGFQPDARHFGIDIAATKGTEVRAVSDGVVINSDWTVNFGYVIHLQHANGIMTVYKHCANLLKQEGDIVLKGDILGTIGHSGVLSSGPHVHFEIWKNGIPLNPTTYLTKN